MTQISLMQHVTSTVYPLSNHHTNTATSHYQPHSYHKPIFQDFTTTKKPSPRQRAIPLRTEPFHLHQAPNPQSFPNMTTATATAHAKRPFVGGGAFKERNLANRALESERKLRELMGMLLEAVLSGPLEKEEVSSTQELEAGDDDEWEDVEDEDNEEWEDVEDGEDCEGVDDQDEWEDIKDDEELDDVENEDDLEDIDDKEDREDTEEAESALLSSLRALMQPLTLSSPSEPPTQTHTLPESSRYDSEDGYSSDDDSSDLISDTPNDKSSITNSSDDSCSDNSGPDDSSSDNSSSDDSSSSNDDLSDSDLLDSSDSSDDDLSDEDSSDFSDLSDSSDSSESSDSASSNCTNNPNSSSNHSPTKPSPSSPISFTTIEDARTAYYSMLQKVENLLVDWYHKNDVRELTKFLIESAQATYAEQVEREG